MYRPRTVYRAKERTGRAATLILSILALLALVVVLLLLDLQQYMVYDKDGARLVLPSEASASPLAADPETGAAPAAPVAAELVIEQPDYSAVVTDAGAELSPLRARLVPAREVTAARLEGYAADGLGGYGALVLELKPATGLLAYKSGVPLTNSYALNGTLELREHTARLKANGVYLAARLSALTDAALAVRDAPIALKDAAGGVYTADGLAWLDPYGDTARAYLAALMEELADMGFDEIVFDGLYLPAEGYTFSAAMTAVPDAETAVSAFSLYLRETADALNLKISGIAAPDANGQDYAVFFKAFDRAVYADDAAFTAALRDVLGADGDTRLVPVCDGYIPAHESYIVK